MSVKTFESSIKNSISACLVVHNDQEQIGRCLKSVIGVVDEIIIVHDGPCTDKTLKIARKYTNKIWIGKTCGYPEPHRITTFKKARGNWILILDADEYLSNKLRKNLRKLVNSGNADGYMFLWRFWDGKKYYTHQWPHRIGVVKKTSLQFLAILHPDWTIHGTSLDVPLQLEHKPAYNNVTLSAFRTKWMHWLRLHAKQVLTPISAIPRYQYYKKQKPKHIEWIAHYDLLIAPFIFIYFFLGSLKLSFPTEKFSLWKYAFYQALYYAFLCYEVYILKRTNMKFSSSKVRA
ncbi:MAG: glycosyltransferase [Candidatus Pacebacteria bacterium]|nr:glycosyltransferase [Candidatus Paceibacterota bacterium]